MIKSELLNIVNTKETWAFIGSGPSIDAGGPTWENLIERTEEFITESGVPEIIANKVYIEAKRKDDFPKCFSIVERAIGREAFEKIIREEVSRVKSPGRILLEILEWPFRGFITTNYDDLIEVGLRELNERGWAPVGNTDGELRQISGNAEKVIWHIHGGGRREEASSELLITEEDYDKIYLGNGLFKRQLLGLFAQRRVVFFGAGFRDPEFNRILKQVKETSNPAKPAYAFISGLQGPETENVGEDLFYRYNIDTIPYSVENGSHKQLLEILYTYKPFIVKRTFGYHEKPFETPTFDPEATGLLIYNEFCLKENPVVSTEVINTLLKARILSMLKYKGPLSLNSVVEDLRSRLYALGTDIESEDIISEATERAISELKDRNLINLSEKEGLEFSLSEKGVEFVVDFQASAELLSKQFSQSLEDRAREIIPTREASVKRVAAVAEYFIKDSIKKRALGLAIVLFVEAADTQDYHTATLLQNLPEYMAHLQTHEEAHALVMLIMGLFSKLTDIERRYIGSSIQAQFGVNVIGLEPNSLDARTEEVKSSFLLIDSSTLIPLLAKSTVGFDPANFLIDKLTEGGTCLGTTYLLAEEVAEHARWAIKQTETTQGRINIQSLSKITGKYGAKSNEFLEGWVKEITRGRNDYNLLDYLEGIFGERKPTYTAEDVGNALSKKGVLCIRFQDWEGFENAFFSEREDYQEEIKALRETKGSFTHYRQVKAEAEALMLIKKIREGFITIADKNFPSSYFISFTRVIDEVSGSKNPVTMKPEALNQWIATLNPVPVEELGFLADALLWELEEKGSNIIDYNDLAFAFGPIIRAAKKDLAEILRKHRLLLSKKYGEDSLKAFEDVPETDAPFLLEKVQKQTIEYLESRLTEISKKEKLSSKEREELYRLKAEKRERQKKSQKQKRRAASKKHKTKRKRNK